MICRNCGIEIADKALICYRCGTATTEAKYRPPVASSSTRRPSLVAAVLALVAVIALAFGLVSTDGPLRTTAFVAAALALVAAVLLGARRFSRRG
jgi:hypothetical protein